MTAKSTKIRNLDDELGFTDEDITPSEVLDTSPLKVLGIEVRVIHTLNVFNFAALSQRGAGTGEVMDFLKGFIHPDDFGRFADTASRAPALNGANGMENLFKVLNLITEVAAAPFGQPEAQTPDSRSSGLPRTASTRRSTPKSRASTSATRAAR